MVVKSETLRGAGINAAAGERAFEHLQTSGIEAAGIDFSGSVPDWCELGFSICESYLIEAHNLFLEQDPAGFLSIAEAQLDEDLADAALAHANALLVGVAFRRLAGQLQLVEAEVAPDLNWPNVANLWRAMETTQGDMRMPRLDGGFERELRAALRLI
jgi:hypothetical protein